MSAAHTPGPWTVSDKIAKLGEDRFLTIISLDRWVAHVLEGSPLAEEDASLISAAPELLSALRRLYDEFCSAGYKPDEYPSLALARAAIVKAEGQS